MMGEKKALSSNLTRSTKHQTTKRKKMSGGTPPGSAVMSSATASSTTTASASASSPSTSRASHKFIKSSQYSLTPPPCKHCGEILVGIIFECTVCRMQIHETCLPRVKGACGSAKTKPYVIVDSLADLSDLPLEEETHMFYWASFSRPSYCNYCRDMLFGLSKQGLLCGVCNYVTHETCLKFLTKPCKSFTHKGRELCHNWVEGNHSAHPDTDYTCSVCREACGSYLSLADYRCSWCLQSVHTACLKSAPTACHLPDYYLHPSMVTRDDDGNYSVLPNDTAKPLVVFVNKRSGGLQGKEVLAGLLSLLHPLQIFSLDKGGPDQGLDFMNVLYPKFRILVCGGDGTVGWVLESLRKKGKQQAQVGVLALGTGNDMSRALGWGGGFTSGESLRGFLTKISLATTVRVDRWLLNIAPLNVDTNTVGEFVQKNVVNNYFSIGLDAAVAHEFHQKRESNPTAFNSRVGNKLWYVVLSAAVLFESVPQLCDYITLEVDGAAVPLPAAEGLVILNLPSCYGGTNLWGSLTPEEQERGLLPISPDDGLLEVVVLKSVLELGQINARTALPTKLTQGRDIKITARTKATFPCQFDGEPFMQEPCVIHISHLEQVFMLRNTLP
ncbi:diacylglycerol kinase gamma [Pelomyxa schiedti]|nr:diacylglycerol kinase gamma [Pelomyxa schiedti]